MLIDKRTASYNDDTITATGGDLGDSIDLTVSGMGGVGNPIYLCVAISAMDAASGDETYSVKWQDAAALDGSGDLSGARDIPGSTMTFSRADGSDFKWATIPGDHECHRYIAASAQFGGTTPSAKLTAWVTGERPEKYRSFADAVTFSATA